MTARDPRGTSTQPIWRALLRLRVAKYAVAAVMVTAITKLVNPALNKAVGLPSSAKAARVEIVRISAATAAARNALCKTGNENPQPVPSRQ